MSLKSVKSEPLFTGSIYLLSCKKTELHSVNINVLVSYLFSKTNYNLTNPKICINLFIKNSEGQTSNLHTCEVPISDPFNSKSQVISIASDFSSLSTGKYTAELQLLDLNGFDLAPNDNHYCVFDFEVSSDNQVWINALPSYLSLVSISETEWTQPTILSLRGSVKNIGQRSWIRKAGLGSVKLGGILSHKSSNNIEIAAEYRYELPKDIIQPQNSFDFIIIISISDLEVGDYELVLDLVKEGDFWFRQYFGDSGSLVKFEIKNKFKAQQPVSSLYLPVNSKVWGTINTKIIWICPTLPEVDQSTGGRRLQLILELQRKLNFNITFLYEFESERSEIYKESLKSLGIDVFGNPLGYLLENPQPDHAVFIIGWYPCAVRNLSAIRSLQPNNKIILDSVDIHWKRNAGAFTKGLSDSSEKQLMIDKSEEIQAYSSVNEVWVVSEVDQKELLSELPSCPTRIIPVPLTKSVETPPGNSASKTNEILFVGGFNHPPNKSAAIWAIEICAIARAKLNAPVLLRIIGAHPPQEILDLHDGVSVVVHGFVEDLTSYYQTATAAIVPLKFGAGVKGKVTEALAYGIPVITNHIGIEGLEVSTSFAQLLGESTEELAQRLMWAITNLDKASQIAKDTFNHLESRIGSLALEHLLQKSIVYPSVTIVIVTFNKLGLLKTCLESLFKYTVHPNFRVAVWSNGCTDGTTDYLRQMRSEYPKLLDIHLNPANDYFIKPNNSLFEIYDTDDIVMINNDIEFTDSRWLLALADAAYSSNLIACAGGLTFSPEGKVLEAGARILPNGYGVNEFRGCSLDNPEVSHFRYVGYSSGCFLYLKREAINSVGLLDELYYPMYFEDCDWQYRAHQMGLKTIYTPFAKAIHREGSSAGNDTAAGLKQFQESNRSKFIQRFGSVIDELQY